MLAIARLGLLQPQPIGSFAANAAGLKQAQSGLNGSGPNRAQTCSP